MSALASGLRVQTAADDPSGLAISQNIQAKVNGLQQSVQNVQTANNLLSTADATLDTVQRILSRIHSLIVQSRSDLKSNDELQGIQSEIDALLQEINKISSEANFNGIKLFAGNQSTIPNPKPVPTVKVIQSEPNPDGTPARQQVYDYNNSGGPNPGDFITNFTYLTPSSDVLNSIVSFRVLSYSNNPVDPHYGALGQPGVLIQISAYSTSSNFGAAPYESYVQAVPTGAGVQSGATESAPSGTTLLNFDLANLSPQDVGVAMTFEVSPPKTPSNPFLAGGPQQLSFNDSGTEGGANVVNLPALNTNVLQISDINVLDPTAVDHFANTPNGVASSNQLNADLAEVRVTDAQDQLSFMRAQLGAQTVSLNADANDASIAIVNETSAMSSIRDTNIAATSIELTKDQILTQFGTSVLAQMQANQQQLMSLMVAQSLH